MDIYKILGASFSPLMKSFDLELLMFNDSLQNTVELLLHDNFCLTTGSKAEGTNITPSDYHSSIRQSLPSGCFSDIDFMDVLYDMRVFEESDELPQHFDNYIYCRAERGEHTTEGFRKLRMVHNPKHYSVNQNKESTFQDLKQLINLSIEDGYISSGRFLVEAFTLIQEVPCKHSVQNGLGLKGPSTCIVKACSSVDCVRCFYVKTWPKEAESWLMRHTKWPEKQLKRRIKNIGYMLVPTGNSKSQESNLEWRCSFSVAEKILITSVNKFQRYTFIMLKVLLKEYLPPDINTDGEKQLLSTYHMKTVFLWCLEDSKLKWEPKNMLGIIGHILDVLLSWIHKEHFPHYFIPSVNLFDERQLHDKKKTFKNFISAIRNDLSNKIRQLQFFKSQEISTSTLNITNISESHLCAFYNFVSYELAGKLQICLHRKLRHRPEHNSEVQFNMHILHTNLLVSFTHDRDPYLQHLYRTIYSDPVHDKLLTDVVPGLLDQYRGCIHLARYCIAKRDGHVLPYTLHVAESLLNDTLHLDPCSGYVKLACLYIATGDFVNAIDKLNIAENNIEYQYMRIRLSASGEQVDTDLITKVFREWVEGQVVSNIVVMWPEYIIVPDFLQFEMIHEMKQKAFDLPLALKETGRMLTRLVSQLQWPPLRMIKLLRFVCAKSTRASTRDLEEIVEDMIYSDMSAIGVNDKYTVLNMSSWCYIQIKNYKLAAWTMILAIVSRADAEISEDYDVMKGYAFCHHFLTYVISQCLL